MITKSFFNKILIRKRGLILLGLFIFFGLFLIARPVYAILGLTEDIWGLLESQLDALDFVEEGFLSFFKTLLFWLLGSFIFLVTASYVLQWAISLPINLGNPLVGAGFNFILGITNLLLILIFVVIAIAYILKIETFATKKTLINLLIVALLVNFSLVFVGALVDIFWIIQRTVINAFGSDFPSLAVQPLTSSSFNLILGYLALFGGYAVAALIPFVNVGYFMFILIMAISELFFGTLTTTLVLTILQLAVGIIFFLYAFLFLARIAMIWILAILGPLALSASILPITQRYWRRWLGLLFQWLSLGILALFLSGLVLKFFSIIVTPGGEITPLLGVKLPTLIYNYIFLLILLGVTYHISKKYIPEFAGVVISQSERAAKRGARLMDKMILERIRKRLGPGIRKRLPKKWAGKELERTAKPWREMTYRERLRAAFTRPLAGWVTRQAKEIEQIRLEREKKEAEKAKDATSAFAKFTEAMRAGDLVSAIARLTNAIEKGGPFKKTFEKNVTREQAIRLAEYANRIGAGEDAEKIGKLFAHEKEVISKMGFEIKDEDREKYTTKREKERGIVPDDATILQRKLFAEARKTDEIKQFSKEFWKNPAAMDAIQDFWGGHQLRVAAEEFGRFFVEAYMEAAERRGVPRFLEQNPGALLYLSGNAAQDFGFYSLRGLTRGGVRKELRRYRARERRERRERR